MAAREAHSRRAVELTLFLTSFLTFAFFYQAADQSTAARFDLMRSILERHTLAIDGFAGWNTADIVRLHGHIYSAKAPGTTFTGIAQWFIFSKLLAPLKSNPDVYWALLTHLTIVFSTSLAVALMAIVIFRFADFLGASPGRSAALALIVSFATIIFPYATEMTGEPISAVCSITAFYLLTTYRREPEADRALAAGLLAGWAVLCMFPAVLISSALTIYAFFKLRRRHFASFAVGAAAIAILLLAYDRAAFGNPLYLSYEAYKLPANSQFPEQARGFVGLTFPKVWVLWKILIDPQRGLFFCNPVLLMAIPGLIYFNRKKKWRAEFFVTIFAIVSFILFNASFGRSIQSWGGGTATGPRYLAGMVPFMALTLAFLPSEWNYILGGLAVISAFLMLMATSVNPHFPYEYENPIRDYVMPAFFRGDLAYNKDAYFGGGPIAGDSVAFNLGKLAGLPGALQLLPLAGIWIAAGLALIGQLKLWPAGVRRRLASASAALLILALFLPPFTGIAGPASDPSQSHGLLGRYYEGVNPSKFPPHIVRVDPRIDFGSIADLGALPFPSCVEWTGALLISHPGVYEFTIEADDSGWLTIDGHKVIGDPGKLYRPLARGRVHLAKGRHTIKVGERNVAGDAKMRLFWKPPGGAFELVPSAVLLPATNG